MSPVLAISANTAWSMLNFRKNLLLALQEAGYRTAVIAPIDSASAELAAMGVEFVPLKLNSRGVSVLDDLNLLLQYWRILRRLRPVAYVGYTIKANIYGSLIAGILRIPVINNITGLGTVFAERGVLQSIVSTMYRMALSRSRRIFFLNPEDRDLFLARKLVTADQATLIRGEGVDLNHFRPSKSAALNEFTFLLVSRLIWEKGIAEYVAAAKALRQRGHRLRFQLLGFIDNVDTSAVKAADIEQWEQEGTITYLGGSADVRPFIANADCLVLPSWYPEGVPRVLMEAAAMARPIITTNTPGCREVVEEGVNGFLCTPQSADSLATAMLKIASLAPAKREAMGRASRKKAEREFGDEQVIDAYLRALDSALPALPARIGTTTRRGTYKRRPAV